MLFFKNKTRRVINYISQWVSSLFEAKIVIKKKIIVNGVDINPQSEEGKAICMKIERKFDALDKEIKAMFDEIKGDWRNR